MTVRGTSQLVVAFLLAALLAACTPDGEPEEPPEDGTVETPTDPEEPAEPEDPYAIPDEITTAYLDRVFEALNDVALEARNEVIENEEYTERADKLLSSIATGFAAMDDRQALERLIGEDSEESPGGPLVTTATRVVDRDDGCVVAIARQDRSLLLADPPPVTNTFTFLVQRPATWDADLNPTPWRLAARVPYKEIASRPHDELCADLLSALKDS